MAESPPSRFGTYIYPNKKKQPELGDKEIYGLFGLIKGKNVSIDIDSKFFAERAKRLNAIESHARLESRPIVEAEIQPVSDEPKSTSTFRVIGTTKKRKLSESKKSPKTKVGSKVQQSTIPCEDSIFANIARESIPERLDNFNEIMEELNNLMIDISNSLVKDLDMQLKSDESKSASTSGASGETKRSDESKSASTSGATKKSDKLKPKPDKSSKTTVDSTVQSSSIPSEDSSSTNIARSSISESSDGFSEIMEQINKLVIDLPDSLAGDEDMKLKSDESKPASNSGATKKSELKSASTSGETKKSDKLKSKPDKSSKTTVGSTIQSSEDSSSANIARSSISERLHSFPEIREQFSKLMIDLPDSLVKDMDMQLESDSKSASTSGESSATKKSDESKSSGTSGATKKSDKLKSMRDKSLKTTVDSKVQSSSIPSKDSSSAANIARASIAERLRSLPKVGEVFNKLLINLPDSLVEEVDYLIKIEESKSESTPGATKSDVKLKSEPEKSSSANITDASVSARLASSSGITEKFDELLIDPPAAFADGAVAAANPLASSKGTETPSASLSQASVSPSIKVTGPEKSSAKRRKKRKGKSNQAKGSQSTDQKPEEKPKIKEPEFPVWELDLSILDVIGRLNPSYLESLERDIANFEAVCKDIQKFAESLKSSTKKPKK